MKGTRRHSEEQVIGIEVPPFAVQSHVSSQLILRFSGDEVRSRGRRLSPLLWQPCTSFPHAVISAAFLATSAGGK